MDKLILQRNSSTLNIQINPKDVGYAVSENWKIAYGLISLFSMTLSLIIPVVYYLSKKSRHHPALLLVLICVFEMISCYHLMIWAMDLDNFLWFFHIYGLQKIWLGQYSEYEFSPPFDPDNQIKYEYVSKDNVQYCYMNFTLYFFSLFLEFGYYIILCIDLIITLKRPFIGGSSRMLFYNLFVIISASILLIAIYPNIVSQCNLQQKLEISQHINPKLSIAYYPVIFTEITFYFFGLISIFMALKERHRHQKTNSEIFAAKNQYLLNHCIFIIVMFCVWIIPFYNNIANGDFQIQVLNNISFCLLLSQGIVLGLLRLSEPFFRLRIKIYLKTLFCMVTAQELNQIRELEAEDNSEIDVWNFSLASLVGKAQNQEVVSHILRGISQITQYQDGKNVISSNMTGFPDLNQIKYWSQECKKKKFNHKDGIYFQDLSKQRTQNFEAESLVNAQQSLLKDSQSNEDLQDMLVEEFAPKVFQILRNQDGITNDVFQQTLNIKKNEKQIKQAQKSLGRSGSFFFFSHDKKLILKTISNQELKVFMKSFLKRYILHLIQSPESLLARVYGIYKITIIGVEPVNLIMMENSMGQIEKLGGSQRTYDLKGSLINRYVKPIQIKKVRSQYFAPKRQTITSSSFSSNIEESFANFDKMSDTMNEIKPILKAGQVYKDLNFLQSEDLFIALSAHDKESIFEQMKQDTDFLKAQNIMDYSLLLGVSEPTHQQLTKFERHGNYFRAVESLNKKYFSFAIIDYLQVFDFSKQLEFRYKTVIKQKSKDLISCILPTQYQERFLTFMNSIISSFHKY